MNNVFDYVLSVVTLVLGAGWLWTYRAYRRKAAGEATQSEADGWAKMQEVYQKHIEDMEGIIDKAREDRDHLRESRDMYRKENDDLREKYIQMEDQIIVLRRGLARMGRKLEAVLPFTCGVAGCVNRTRLDIQDRIDVDEQQ